MIISRGGIMLKYTRGYCEHCNKTTANVYKMAKKEEQIFCPECNQLKQQETDDYHFRMEHDEETKAKTQQYLNDKAEYRKNNADNIAQLTNKINNTKIQQTYIPKCPTCGSPDIVRISSMTKAINIALFGLLGNRRKKTFHCNNCKYEW